jgi:hypothetical protein
MLDRSLWSAKLTDEVLEDARQRRASFLLDDPGFCLICGLEHGGVEPDARRYRCESCGAREVYGIEEIIMEIYI